MVRRLIPAISCPAASERRACCLRTLVRPGRFPAPLHNVCAAGSSAQRANPHWVRNGDLKIEPSVKLETRYLRIGICRIARHNTDVESRRSQATFRRKFAQNGDGTCTAGGSSADYGGTGASGRRSTTPVQCKTARIPHLAAGFLLVHGRQQQLQRAADRIAERGG